MALIARRRTGRGQHAEVLAELDRLPPRAPGAGPEPGLAQPLSGLRVLDLGLALAGPTCGRLPAEFGAEVVKIGGPGYRATGYLNRGKESASPPQESTPNRSANGGFRRGGLVPRTWGSGECSVWQAPAPR